MALISIRVPDTVLQEVNQLAKASHLTRTEYICDAIKKKNHEILAEERAQHLKKASMRVRKASMRINKEFSEIEHDPEA